VGDGAVVDVHAASTEYAFAVLAESLLGSDIERASARPFGRRPRLSPIGST